MSPADSAAARFDLLCSASPPVSPIVLEIPLVLSSCRFGGSVCGWSIPCQSETVKFWIQAGWIQHEGEILAKAVLGLRLGEGELS